VLLLIDNYDSFVFNLSRYVEELGCESLVVRNDAITLEEIVERQPQGIILSPGPCTPNEAGICIDAVKHLPADLPILGVCLGHQSIAAACGIPVIRAPRPMHGQTSLVHHDNSSLFAGLPNPFVATRYHSLIADVEQVPSCLKVTAWTDDDIVMGLEHRERPLFGVQFHPESVLTHHGHQLLANFLRLCGITPTISPPPEYVAPTIDDDFFNQPINDDARRPV